MALKRRNAAVESVDAGQDTLQIVAFKVGGELYGLDIGCVAEIDRMQTITKVPKALPFVEGVIHLRDMIIPVIDLGKRFGLGPTAEGRHTRIIIARLRGQAVGLVVSAVTEVLTIPLKSLGPAPPLTFDQATRFVAGMARLKDGLISVLSLDRILSTEEVELLHAQQQNLF